MRVTDLWFVALAMSGKVYRDHAIPFCEVRNLVAPVIHIHCPTMNQDKRLVSFAVVHIVNACAVELRKPRLARSFLLPLEMNSQQSCSSCSRAERLCLRLVRKILESRWLCSASVKARASITKPGDAGSHCSQESMFSFHGAFLLLSDINLGVCRCIIIA